MLVLIVATLPCWFEQHWIDLLTMVGTVSTAIIILWQAQLLRKQNQVEALLGLNKRWDSKQLLKLRRIWATSEGVPPTEAVLEFLEECAALSGKYRKVFNGNLIWYSVLGWYAAHYFIYNCDNENIKNIRCKWSDPSLYSDIQRLTLKYIAIEAKRLKQTRESIRKRILSYKKKFKEDEQRRYELFI